MATGRTTALVAAMGLRTGGEDDVRQTLNLNGSRQVGAGGTEVSIWCRNSGSPEGRMHGAQLLTTKIAGAF